jgi:hypothetical protein
MARVREYREREEDDDLPVPGEMIESTTISCREFIKNGQGDSLRKRGGRNCPSKIFIISKVNVVVGYSLPSGTREYCLDCSKIPEFSSNGFKVAGDSTDNR